MKAVIQRVTRASVEIGGETVGSAGKGYLILLGVVDGDGDEQADILARKTVNLRIFCDENDKMNKSLIDVGGDALVVSQFTLCADCKKGNRPSFTSSAAPDEAQRLYERYVNALKDLGVKNVATGVFGADMQVSLVNDGPVTILYNTDDWKGKN